MSGIFEVSVHPASKKLDIRRKLGKIPVYEGGSSAQTDDVIL
jgi:hypothetical protein